MGLSPRKIEEKEFARRQKIRKRYYWNGMELRPKDSVVRRRLMSGAAGRIWNLFRRLPGVLRSHQNE